MRRLPPFSPILYIGMDYERASERAQEVCRIAGETGQTARAEEHLAALNAIMRERMAREMA